MTRAILSFNLNMLIPISKVDANMQTAQKRDACLSEKFYFRKNIFTSLSNGATDTFKACNGTDECDMTEMSINEIVNGNDKFPGLIQIINNCQLI